MNSAAVPTPIEDVQGDGRWLSVHNRFIQETKEKEPDILFVGDSLIQQLSHTEIWDKNFEPLHCLNFGMGADETQHVLWRLQNGELEYIKPKIVVVLVGTNNHRHTAQQVVTGIETIVRLISSKQPQAYIIVLAIPPRGQVPNPLREKIKEINQSLPSVLTNIPKSQLVNIDNGLVQADGTINHHDMYDYLHLTRQGYQKAFEPVYDLILQLLSE